MRRNDTVKLGDIYGDMLKNVNVVEESQVKAGGNNLSDKNPAPLQDGGPKEAGGWRKALDDAYSDVYGFNNEEDEEDYPDSYATKKIRKLKDAANKPGISDNAKKDLEKQIKQLTGTEDEENITESKKIAKKSLNNIMARKKSTFDRLFEQVLKENFGMGEENEDLDALGLDDAASDDELGDDFDLGGEEEDSVTFTLDRATAQALCDVLQGALGGDEGDDLDLEGGDDMDFGGEDDGMDFDEDEETVGPQNSKDGAHPLQGRNNKVQGKPQPGGGSADHSVTDKVGNDGDHGHPQHGARKANDGKNQKVSNIKQGEDFFR
jgi:hypothetical protein